MKFVECSLEVLKQLNCPLIPNHSRTLSNRGLLTCAPAKREWQSLEVLKMKQLLQFYFCRHSALRKDCFNMVAAVLRDWRAALRRHCTVLIAGEHTTVICLGLRLKGWMSS